MNSHTPSKFAENASNTADAQAFDTAENHQEPLYRLEERLLREERRLAEGLVRRTRLLAEISARRKQDKRSAASEHALEKSLWSVWEKVLQLENCGHSRHWRQLVAQCNNLAYALGDQKASRQAKPWRLRPTAPSRAVSLSGPTDSLTAKIAISWAVLANAPLRVRPVLLNDSVVELIKALNQTGAGLSWEGETVTHAPSRTPDQFSEHKAIHVGQHPSNLALLLAMVLARPGIARFSGSGALNLLHLKPWQNFFPQLGARLHQLNPHAPGLPVRLESAGDPVSAQISNETPEELVLALLAMAPFYPKGLRLVWTEKIGLKPRLESIIRLYAQHGVPCSVESDAVTVASTQPRLPEELNIPLDGTLSAMLLTWSRFTGQTMRLEGQWTGKEAISEPPLSLLRACGVHVQFTAGRVQAEPRAWPETSALDLQGLQQALPLALTLALSAPGKSILSGLPPEYDREMISRLAKWAGRTCSEESSSLQFHPLPRGADRTDFHFEAPDALWAMAAAMLSFTHPGLHLVNPGELAGVWPGFWPIYHTVLSLPRKPVADSAAQGPKHHAHQPSTPVKRRIKI